MDMEMYFSKKHVHVLSICVHGTTSIRSLVPGVERRVARQHGEAQFGQRGPRKVLPAPMLILLPPPATGPFQPAEL